MKTGKNVISLEEALTRLELEENKALSEDGAVQVGDASVAAVVEEGNEHKLDLSEADLNLLKDTATADESDAHGKVSAVSNEERDVVDAGEPQVDVDPVTEIMERQPDGQEPADDEPEVTNVETTDTEVGSEVESDGEVEPAVEPETETETADESVAEAEGVAEEVAEPVDGNVSTEGFGGGLLGFIIGTVAYPIGSVLGAAGKIKRDRLSAKIRDVATKIAKVRNGEIKTAEQAGVELPATIKDVNASEVIKAALLGLIFSPFYNAHNGSELENLNSQLNKLLDELKSELDAAGISTEDFAPVEQDTQVETTEVVEPTESDEGAAEDGTTSEEDDVVEPATESLDVETDADIDELEEVTRDATQVVAISTSLEAYNNLIERAIKRDGYIDPMLFRSIKIGLEAFDEPFLLTYASNEDFGVVTSREAVSLEFMDKMKGKASAVKGAVSEAMQRLWNWLMERFNEMSAGVLTYQGKLEKLAKAIEALPSDAKPKNTKITTSIPELQRGTIRVGARNGELTNNGKFVSTFTKVAAETFNEVLSEGGSFKGDAARTAGKMNLKVVKNESEWPDAVSGCTQVYTSEPLLGNHQLWAGFNGTEVPVFEVVKNDNEVLEVNGNVWDKQSLTIAVKAATEGLETLRTLAASKREVSKVMDTIKKEVSKTEGTDGKVLNSIAKSSIATTGRLIKAHAASVKAMVNFIETNLKEYE